MWTMPHLTAQVNMFHAICQIILYPETKSKLSSMKREKNLLKIFMKWSLTNATLDKSLLLSRLMTPLSGLMCSVYIMRYINAIGVLWHTAATCQSKMMRGFYFKLLNKFPKICSTKEKSELWKKRLVNIFLVSMLIFFVPFIKIIFKTSNRSFIPTRMKERWSFLCLKYPSQESVM